MQKIGILLASFFMLSAVSLGAFGAHGLKNLISAESLFIFKTAVLYQFIHAIGLFIVLILAKIYHLKRLRFSLYFMVVGIVFFSGSLYLLATKSYTGINLWILGPMTPIGGMFFILAWLVLFVVAWREIPYE